MEARKYFLRCNLGTGFGFGRRRWEVREVKSKEEDDDDGGLAKKTTGAT